jgi:hypothetical protein
MSSLIFATDSEQVLVATDTLATSPNGDPSFFTTKAFIVPHLEMIMCGTGTSGFLGRWFVEVNDRMVVSCIENLDYHTPKILSSLWQDFKRDNSIPDHFSTTVYHFGFSGEDGSILSYAYRSSNNFVSEALSYGIGVKPECVVFEGIELPRDIKRLMDEQRSIQQSLPKGERVFIGGKIQIHHLTRMGFCVYVLDQFDDFEEAQQKIFENYNSRKSEVG